MKWIVLSIVAYMGVTIATPVVASINIFRYKDYLKNIAIGFDQAGGCVLYNEEDWTISSYTYYLCKKHNKYCVFMKFIELLFGSGHCQRSFEHEKTKMKKEIKL